MMGLSWRILKLPSDFVPKQLGRSCLSLFMPSFHGRSREGHVLRNFLYCTVWQIFATRSDSKCLKRLVNGQSLHGSLAGFKGSLCGREGSREQTRERRDQSQTPYHQLLDLPKLSLVLWFAYNALRLLQHTARKNWMIRVLIPPPL